ncbi:MAG: NAD(P)/FAD-dependent oxidoreductase [Pseudomonadota bacterium]
MTHIASHSAFAPDDVRTATANRAPRDPIIVIGAGPIGLYAAFQVGLRGMRPVIVDALPEVGGQCAALYPEGEILDAPGFPAIKAAELIARLTEQLSPFDPLYLTSRRAMSVWGSVESGFSVETDTGETITGAGVIFAGGAGALRPRRLAAKGAEGLGPKALGYAPEAAPEAGRIAIVGAGPTAVETALAFASASETTALIHDAPLSAAPARIDALHAEARLNRLTLIEGEVTRIESADGRLTAIDVVTDVASGGETLRYDLDYLLVQAGLELIQGGLTGLEPIRDPRTGETATPGVFITGDAVEGEGRPPVVAAGFAEAVRAAEAMQDRVAPDAPRALPHTASSPMLRARLGAA